MEAYVMDAFSAQIFGGNQAGVVLPDRQLSDALMQQIAGEFKHSETAFVRVESDGSVTLRYFTPAGEVDLCVQSFHFGSEIRKLILSLFHFRLNV